MGIYKIGDYYFKFNYLFDDFFKERILKYKVDKANSIDFSMDCYLEDIVAPPVGRVIQRHNNKILLDLGSEKAILFYKEDVLEIIVYYNDNYQNVRIIFNSILNYRIPDLEYILTGYIFGSMMATKGIITLHASAISYRNEAILFSASSTTGKSTHASLWQKFKDDVVIINDDKPLIQIRNDHIVVLGSPWSGKTPLNENLVVPLRAICFLSQGKSNKIRTLDNKEKLLYLLKNIHRPTEKEIYQEIITNIEYLINNTLMYHLECNISQEAVEVAYNKIYKEKSR